MARSRWWMSTAWSQGCCRRARLRYETPVMPECMEMGGRTLTLGPAALTCRLRRRLCCPTIMPWWAQPVLYLPTLQLLAYHRSVSKGLNPDSPRNLTAVVDLDRDELLASTMQYEFS